MLRGTRLVNEILVKLEEIGGILDGNKVFFYLFL
jgi:hypothetical protein